MLAPETGAQAIEVSHLGKVIVAQEAARAFAGAVGFGETECEQIAIVASELASNLVKYAGGGTLTLSALTEDGRSGMQVESADHGPGIPNLQQALDDGYSTGGSLGVGLGAINRFMDDLELQSTPAGGTRLVCRRWLRPSCSEVYPHWLDFGVATRARGLARENGDAFVVKCWPQHALVGVIDGLGHGEFAQRAALAARLYVEDHFDQPLDHLFVGTDRACHSTRGVVMALAHFDLSAGHFNMASIGNIEARLCGSLDRRDFVVRRGIVGAHPQHAVVTEHRWTPESILVLHSDGLHTHWTWDDFPQEAWQTPAQAAQLLLRRLGKDDDDATVLVVKSAAHDV